MSAIRPPLRPQQIAKRSAALLQAAGVTAAVKLLGMRGYYRRTMGDPTRNDIGIYDDSIYVVGQDCHVAFNANTDPSVLRPDIATLKHGLWLYEIGKHGINREENGGPPAYIALVQAAPVTVLRQGGGEDTGMFGITSHRGGYHTTSSEGCQTVFPDQWHGFISLVQDQLRRNNQTQIPYLLVEEDV